MFPSASTNTSITVFLEKFDGQFEKNALAVAMCATNNSN